MPVIRDASDQQIEKAAQVLRDSADEISEATGQAARTAQDNVQTGLNAASAGLRQGTEPFSHAFTFSGAGTETFARRSAEGFGAATQAGTVFTRAVQEISRECLGLAQERLRKNMEAFTALAGARTVPDFVSAQSGFMRDYWQGMLEDSRRIAALSMRFAGEAAQGLPNGTSRPGA